MFNEPRNWKWAVPMMLMAPFGLAAYWLMQVETIWISYLACIPGTMMLAMAILAVSNYVRYQVEWRTYVFDQRQRALNVTPVTLLADALKGMHPEAVKVLNRFGVRANWQVGVDTEAGSQEWTLLGMNVHFGFIEFILENSTRLGLYPKRMLSEGSRKWDRDGMVTDYEQYDELQNWMIGRLMVTRPFGNQPSQFIPPWNPDAVREVMGLASREVELWKPDLTPSPSPNGRAPFGEGGNGKKFVDDKLDDLISLNFQK
jgi:hypothetical protein